VRREKSERDVASSSFSFTPLPALFGLTRTREGFLWLILYVTTTKKERKKEKKKEIERERERKLILQF
jgi:hypothetical protein